MLTEIEIQAKTSQLTGFLSLKFGSLEIIF